MPYIEYAHHRVIEGAEAIYILSRGGKNKPALRLASKIAKICNLKIVNTSVYEEFIEGEVKEALCLELRKEKTLNSELEKLT